MAARATGGRRLRTCGQLGVCAVVVIALLLQPRRAAAASSGWVQVTATGHGVRLTLSMRNRSYPQNALVRIWARMQNLTGHRVYLFDSGPPAAGKYIPQAVVTAEPGGEPLPISLDYYLPYPGPPPFVEWLSPHAIHNIPELIILRGPLVRLDLTFATGRGQPVYAGPTLSTPPLHANLTAPDTPAVSLHVPPDNPSATITPSGPVRGDLLAVFYYNCGPNVTGVTQDQIDWTAISPNITPTCSPLLSWHEVAGWLNHSVVQIDWGQGSSSS